MNSLLNKKLLDELFEAHKALTMDDIKNYPELVQKVDWGLLDYEKFDENFIEEYKDYIDWQQVSVHVKLSAKFIRKYADNLYWNLISFYQIFTPEMEKEFEDRIYWIGFESLNSATYEAGI